MAAKLSPEVCKRIGLCQSREEGRVATREALEVTAAADDLFTRDDIYIDFIYDTVVFCSRKGFTWASASVLTNLVTHLLWSSLEMSLVNSVKLYKRLVEEVSGQVNDRDLATMSQHVFATFFQHYHLYHSVFTADRTHDHRHTTLTVDTVDDVQPLGDATTKEVWQYHERLRQIEARQREREEARAQHRQAVTTADAARLQEFKASGADNLVHDREKVAGIVQEGAERHCSALEHRINDIMTSAWEDLGFKLEKAALPRPPDLGPPPRYTPKPALVGNKATSTTPKPKKPKSGSRPTSKKK